MPTILSTPGLGLLFGNNSRLVNLVAHNNKWELLRLLRSSVVNEILFPFSKFGKRLSITNIKSYNAAISTPIESESQCLELFLTSSVPKLQCYIAISDLDILSSEVIRNCSFGLCSLATHK